MNINKLKNKNPYNVDRFEKKLFFERMKFLTEHHKKNNAYYSKMLNLSKQKKIFKKLKKYLMFIMSSLSYWIYIRLKKRIYLKF